MNVELLKLLRTTSGVSISLCKEALEKSEWDFEKAKTLLRSMGNEILEETQKEEVHNGLIECYLHHNKQVAVILELRCQTDFTARILGEFARAICMHIAATNPEYISERDVPKERVNSEKLRILEEMELQDKPDEAVSLIVKNRMKRFYMEHCLMGQKSVHNTLITVRDFINDKIKQTGENIVIVRFVRYQVGK
jgi:elongation factor Ts